MAYTWTTGEVITADKLNATGGGGEFLITFTVSYDEDEGYNETVADKTVEEVIQAYTSGSILRALVTGEYNDGSTTQPIPPMIINDYYVLSNDGYYSFTFNSPLYDGYAVDDTMFFSQDIAVIDNEGQIEASVKKYTLKKVSSQ